VFLLYLPLCALGPANLIRAFRISYIIQRWAMLHETDCRNKLTCWFPDILELVELAA
jgi:hypothetical protein